jgi:hypothetical protein
LIPKFALEQMLICLPTSKQRVHALR